VLAEKVFAELHQQRAWWTRAHLTVEVARWISEPSPLTVEVEVERLAAMCLPLEPDSDVEYAQPDIAKLTSPTIMRAERRVIASLDEPAPFTVATVRDHGSVTTRSAPSVRSPKAAAASPRSSGRPAPGRRRCFKPPADPSSTRHAI
jgi:hypothetical protein